MRTLILLAFFLANGCGAGAEEKRKQAEAKQRAFMEAEAKARAEHEAKEAKLALEAATSGCNGGDAKACIELGKIHFDGKGVERDIEKAVTYYAKACALKEKDGCRLAAQHETDQKEKLGYLVSLCDLQDADACLEAAAVADQLTRNGVLPEAKKAAERQPMQLLKKACALGGALACTTRGVALLDEDAKQAMESFTKGCELGEPKSCMSLADMYATGKGVRKKDVKKAVELKKKACEAGLAEAC